jgi:hypothetical protein
MFQAGGSGYVCSLFSNFFICIKLKPYYVGNVSGANQPLCATVQTSNLNHMMLVQGTHGREHYDCMASPTATRSPLIYSKPIFCQKKMAFQRNFVFQARLRSCLPFQFMNVATDTKLEGNNNYL